MKIKGITKKHHVYTDYTYVPLVFAALMLAGFSANKLGRLTCGAFAFSTLSYSLCTKAKWSVVKLIPYKIYSVLDLISDVFALAVCLLPVIRADKRTRNKFIANGHYRVGGSEPFIDRCSKKQKTHQIIYTY